MKTQPRLRPLLIFDGDCEFCRRWIRRWEARTGARVDYRPWQATSEIPPDLPQSLLGESIALVQPSGEVLAGADGVFALSGYMPGWRWFRGLASLPGVLPCARLIYRWVARRRSQLSRIGL